MPLTGCAPRLITARHVDGNYRRLPPAITGVTTTLLQHPYVAETRMWFIEKNSLRVWYLRQLRGAAVRWILVCSVVAALLIQHRGQLASGFGVGLDCAHIRRRGGRYTSANPSSASNWSQWLTLPAPQWVSSASHKYGSRPAVWHQSLRYCPCRRGHSFAELGEKGSNTDKIQRTYSTTSAPNINFGWQIAISRCRHADIPSCYSYGVGNVLHEYPDGA